MFRLFSFLAIFVTTAALADAPVIWSGTTAKWLPSGLQSAGICHLDSSGVQTSSLIVSADVSGSAAIPFTKFASTTASRAMITNVGGYLEASTTTANELSFLSGVTSAVQTQLDGMAKLAGRSGGQTLNGDTAASGNIVLSSTADSTKGKIYLGASSYYQETVGTELLKILGTTTNQDLFSLKGSGVAEYIFGIQSNRLYMCQGSNCYWTLEGGWQSHGTAGGAPRYAFDVNFSATSTAPLTDITHNSATYNLPLVAVRNLSNTANTYSGILLQGGGSTQEAGVQILGIHESTTLGAESSHLDINMRDTGVVTNRLRLSTSGSLTLSQYGAGIAKFDSAGLVSSASAIALGSEVSGTLPLANGGTGQTSFTNHGVILGQGASALAVTAAGGGGTVLQGVASSDPAFTVSPTLGIAGSTSGSLALAGSSSGAVTIRPQLAAGTYNFNLPIDAGTAGQPLLSGGGGSAAQTYGTLGVAAGGTSLTTLTANALYVGNGASAPSAVAVGTNNTVLHGNTGAAPSFSAIVAADLPAITTSSISSTDIDWSVLAKVGDLYTKTLSANTTFTFSNRTAGQTIVVRVTNTASNYTAAWPAGIHWVSATTPTLTTGAKSDIFTFIYDGTAVYGNAVQNMSAP